ncbi:MAG: hypothetical protein WCQ00_02680 [bacterium]
MKEIYAEFDPTLYNLKQIIQALTCPINRHATCVEHGCDEWELQKHPEWLIEHYIKYGGAVAFDKKRKEFEKGCDFYNNCLLANWCKLASMQSNHMKCPLKVITDGRVHLHGLACINADVDDAGTNNFQI